MPFMLSVELWGFHLGPAPVIVASLVIALLLCFVVFYLLSFVLIWRRMARATKALKALRGRGGVATKPDVGQIFHRKGSLQHAWAEYAETLHPQTERDENGEEVLAALRATLPAEAFFTSQSAVDTPLHAEFFRHLPGILTGIGIIGTFSGLIMGLHDFKITSQPNELNAGLAGLIASVTEAFVASGFAIAVAMFVTLLEKLCLNIAYLSLDKLVAAIDTLYDAGVGEEYLRRLVQSSEESATQTRHLKDSLVEDLKQLLTDLTERQIAAGREMNHGLAGQIGGAISQSLETPLSRIAGVVERASSDQGSQVHGMLQDVLAAFMAKLDDTLGGSMQNLSSMMGDSVGAMRDMQAGFQKLLDDMGRAGDSANRAMGDQLAQMMADAELRQRQMVDSLALAVEEMQKRMVGGQAEVQSQMTTAVAELKDAMRGMMTELAEQRAAQSRNGEADMQRMQQTMQEMLERLAQSGEQAARSYGNRIDETLGAVQSKMDEFLTASQSRQDANDKRAQELMQSLDQRIAALLETAKAGADAMRENTRGLNEVTTRAVDGMNRGAETMRLAADGFSTAGTRVAGSLDKAAELQDRLTSAAQGLESQGRAVVEVVGAYDRSRGSLEAMAETLRTVAEEATQRAGLSRQVVDDMSSLVARFEVVQKHTEGYLGQVDDVLKQGFDTFSTAVVDGMQKVHGEFHTELAQAVKMIAYEIDELSAVLETFRAKVD
jgi:putative membrane protein